MKFVIDELWITADAAFLKEKLNLADKLRIAIYTNLLLAKQFLYTEKFFILYIFFIIMFQKSVSGLWPVKNSILN